MQSNNFNYNGPINANANPLSNNWDNVLTYTNYYIEISCTTSCTVTVYQDNVTNGNPLITTFPYSGNGIPVSLSNQIISQYIKFSVNSSSNGTLYFAVVWN